MRNNKVILVTYPDDFNKKEGKSLVESASGNYLITMIFTQKYLNHSKYGIGSGKVEEIKDFLAENPVDLVIIDERLTAKMIYNLEKEIGTKVIDRERLILDIFYSRASTNEAKLQIQLAEIKYQLPQVREKAKILRGNERPGKGGSGEYIVDVNFRDLKRRMGFIVEKLMEAGQKRHLYHTQRFNSNIPIVALVGYTSSGKTTLFNTLTKENKETSSALFTTLSTTTRSFYINDQKFLLTDTVGFINRLPTYMIDAFKSTLEESLDADLILLLLDSSQSIDEFQIKYNSCWKTLKELNVDETKILPVLTKYDKTSSEQIQKIVGYFDIVNPLCISSKTGYGLRKLERTIKQRLDSKNSSN